MRKLLINSIATILTILLTTGSIHLLFWVFELLQDHKKAVIISVSGIMVVVVNLWKRNKGGKMIKGIGQEMCCAKDEKIELPDYLKRVEKEIEELADKTSKLNSFIELEKFEELDLTQQAFLQCQWNAMYSYLSILRQRF